MFVQKLSFVTLVAAECSMYYENQSQDAPYEVRFMIDIGDESSVVRTDPALLSSDLTWSPGDRAIIFKRADGYFLTNDPVLISGSVQFPAGSAQVRIIDNTHNQLIAYQEAEITRNKCLIPASFLIHSNNVWKCWITETGYMIPSNSSKIRKNLD